MLLVSSDAPVTSDQQKRRFSFWRQSPEKCQQSEVTSRAFSGACTIYVSSSVLLFPIAFALVFVFVFLRILEFTTHWRLEICIVWFWSVLLFTTRKNNWYYPVINTISNITIFMTVYVLFRVLGQFCCWPRRMYSPGPGRASGSSGPDMTQTLWAMSTCLCAACVYTNTWNTYNYIKISKTNTKAQTWHRL